MARIRTIKPEFWTDSLMVQLPHFARLLYIALWNAADDHGCIRDEPERLAMELMPRETLADVDGALQLLMACGRVDLMGTEEGETYFQIARWTDHQKVDHPSKSKLLREGSRKLSIPIGVRQQVAKKYGCEPGGIITAECYYCGAPGRVHWFKLHDGRPSGWVVFPELELDHLDCEFSGGETSSENIVLACRRCNRSKGTKHWYDFMSKQFLSHPREKSRAIALDQGSGKGSGKGREGAAHEARDPKPRKPAKTRLPPDFTLTGELAIYVTAKLPDCDPVLLFEQFTGQARAKGWEYVDWPAAFQTYCRNARRDSGHFSAGQYPRRTNGSVHAGVEMR